MPYIFKKAREFLAPELDALLAKVGRPTVTAGEMNYIITRLLDVFVRETGGRYRSMNEAMGILDCAGKEYYRRRIAKYEDQKIAENGDVYDD